MPGEEVADPSLWSREDLQRASLLLPCRCPNGRDDGWMDTGLGWLGSENRKPNLLKIIHGEGESEEAKLLSQQMAFVGACLPAWLMLLKAENFNESVKNQGSRQRCWCGQWTFSKCVRNVR